MDAADETEVILETVGVEKDKEEAQTAEAAEEVELTEKEAERKAGLWEEVALVACSEERKVARAVVVQVGEREEVSLEEAEMVEEEEVAVVAREAVD